MHSEMCSRYQNNKQNRSETILASLMFGIEVRNHKLMYICTVSRKLTPENYCLHVFFCMASNQNVCICCERSIYMYQRTLFMITNISVDPELVSFWFWSTQMTYSSEQNTIRSTVHQQCMLYIVHLFDSSAIVTLTHVHDILFYNQFNFQQ